MVGIKQCYLLEWYHSHNECCSGCPFENRCLFEVEQEEKKLALKLAYLFSPFNK